jgi:DNA-binding NarL/FixJ family response regulator
MIRNGAHADGRVRLLIADDHCIFAESLRVVLAADERIEVIGVACDGQEAVALAAALQPDAILMDVNMPRLDGIEAILRIREAGSTARIVVLTEVESPGCEDAAMAAEADAFLRKNGSLDGLAAALLNGSAR